MRCASISRPLVCFPCVAEGTGCSHFLIVTVLGDTGWDYVTPVVHSVAINGARICNPAFPCSAGVIACGDTFTCGGSTGTSGMCRLLCVWVHVACIRFVWGSHLAD